MFDLLSESGVGDETDTVQLFSRVLLIEDNPAHAQLIRRTLTGLVGEVVHVLTGREGIEAVANEFAELILCDLQLPDIAGAPLLREIRRIRPGVPLVVLTSSSTLDDAVQAMREGAWDFMLKQFSQDLRAQMTIVLERTAERKLRQVRELAVRAERDAFSLAAFTAQDGLAIVGGQGLVVFSNEAFGTFAKLSLSAEPVSPVNVVDLIAQQNYTVAKNLLQELSTRRGGSLWQSEVELLSPSESDQPVRCYFELTLTSVAPRGLETLNVAHSVGVDLHYRVLWVRDITRRKEQERFQRDLLTTTTHDLKGPLGAILTSAELLSDDAYVANRKGEELLTRIASCARSAISIIDELLSARRIQDGVLVVRPQLHDLAEVLADMILDYQPVARAKHIEFSFRSLEEPIQIFADKIGLTRVLGNLVSNAIKFTPKHGKVELFAERVPGGVRVGVSDTGPGIDGKSRHTLFERFGRLERDRDVEGTGVGLFVTKNILEAHGGSVEVKSEVGVGSTFLVTFPDPPTLTP